MASNTDYNYSNPDQDTQGINYLNKLRALRLARDAGTITPAQVQSGYQQVTGRPTTQQPPSNLPYEQLRAARTSGLSPNVIEQMSGVQPATKSVGGIASRLVQSVGNSALPRTLTDMQGTFENPSPYQQPSDKDVAAGLFKKYGKTPFPQGVGLHPMTPRLSSSDFPSQMNPMQAYRQQLMRGADLASVGLQSPGSTGIVNVAGIGAMTPDQFEQYRANSRQNAVGKITPESLKQSQQRYSDFMTGSQQRGAEAMARWKNAEGPRMASPRDREQFARSQQAQAQQNAQANIAGEREAGTEKFKASEAARGMIGAKEAAAAGEAAGINAKGQWDVKAAEAKYAAMAPERRAKALDELTKALTNVEVGSQAHTAISNELSAMGANPATTNASTMTTAQKKDAIKKANPGKTDAELASLYQKHGVV